MLPAEDPEDFTDLLEEASMPLEAVMAKYKLRHETGEGSSAGAIMQPSSDDEDSTSGNMLPVRQSHFRPCIQQKL
jgi:hypothetical protein